MINKILLIGTLLITTACSAKQEQPKELSYKERSKIVMQRVKDTDPLEKQDLVSREAMQYAMLDKMNVREDRQRREFDRIQSQQREDFLAAQEDNINQMEMMNQKMATANAEQLALMTQQQSTITQSVQELKNIENSFNMTTSNFKADSQRQARFFDEMKISYQNKLAFEEAKLARERDRENTIRGVVENMYQDQDIALEQFIIASKEGMLPPSQWVDLADAEVSVHVNDEKFEDLMLRVVNRASIHSGPWQLKWKLKKENEILLYTKFSLDTETTFGKFINNIQQYIVNYNGVILNFSVFKEQRVLIVSDS